jgi:hypothetical protein
MNKRYLLLIIIILISFSLITVGLISCGEGATCENWTGEYVNEEVEDYEDVTRHIIFDKDNMTWNEYYLLPDGGKANETGGKLQKNGCNFTLETESKTFDNLTAVVDENELTLTEGREKIKFQKK